jgi:hypothetical protein
MSPHVFAFFCCIAWLSIYNSFTNIKSISDEYFESMAGVTGTKGKLLKALKEEKAKERFNTPDSIRTKNQE